ncbi:MAG: hypothetical protein OXD45_05745 [Rhodobacteraceae bacterium]|nr:hypothetical protein [Paracoccaceae bacterium]
MERLPVIGIGKVETFLFKPGAASVKERPGRRPAVSPQFLDGGDFL